MEIKEYTELLISVLRSCDLPQKEITYRSDNLKQAENKPSSISIVGNRYHDLAHEIKSLNFLQQFGKTQISCDYAHKPGSDLILNDKYYIECVCASAGDVRISGFEKYCTKNTLGKVIDYNEKANILYSRLTTAIKAKRDFYEERKGRSIPTDKPYIIFLGLGSLANEMFAEDNGFALTSILFGRGNPQIIINSKTGAVVDSGYSHNFKINKWNGSAIDCNVFCSQDYCCVSAILFTDADLFTPYSSNNTFLFINPFADVRVLKKDFKGLVYWSANPDETYSARRNGHKCINTP